MPRVLSADTATLAAQNLVEVLQNPTPNAPFAKINDTHHTDLINLAEFSNIIPKVSGKQSTNRYDGRRWKVEIKPDQVRATITHLCSTRQQQHQAPTPRVQTPKKTGIPPRLAPSEVLMEAQE